MKYVIEVDQPHWDDDDWECLTEAISSTVGYWVPSEGFTIKEVEAK